MRIGVLETGPVLPDLEEEYGPYTAFFGRLLQSVDTEIVVQGWQAFEGELPNDPGEMDGWIISGSKYGAYEDHVWIPPLEDFLRACLESKTPIAGFCFGHQILAQAAGGKVVKSEKGWGLGVHNYEVSRQAEWMAPEKSHFAAIAIHQDQVVEKPEQATVIATSDFCKFAALAYGDPDQPNAISVQPHPEFSRQFGHDLIKSRRGNVFPEITSDDALASLDRGVDNDAWAEWVVSFFRRAIS